MPKKIKKYDSKEDKFRGKVSREYGQSLQQKYRKKAWKKKGKLKVIKSLPHRLAVQFNSYNFKDFPKQKITSLFIYGDVGTGKTILCAYYYLEFVKQLYMQQSSFNKTHYFVVFTDLIEELQKDYKESIDTLTKYRECDLLVLDDFGTRKLTEYVYDRIYLIVNDRYMNMLPTIINSNYTLLEIKNQLDDERIVRRIEEDYTLIEKQPYK